MVSQIKAIASSDPKSPQLPNLPKKPKSPELFPVPPRRVKPFQYPGHHRPDHKYSSIHLALEASLKNFYSRSNLERVLLKKGWLAEADLHRLDHAIADVWSKVVWLKIPARIPYKTTLCRFISKKDFVEAILEEAKKNAADIAAYRCKANLTRFSVKSASSSAVYDLIPTKYACDCDCQAYKGLQIALAEDTYLRGLLNAHPVLQGQLPDKHVFAVWQVWGARDFKQYQFYQGRSRLTGLGIVLDYGIPGNFTVRHKYRKLGSVAIRTSDEGIDYWINFRQLTMLATAPGDGNSYESFEDAAIALAKLIGVLTPTEIEKTDQEFIEEGERAKTDLFGGGWDNPVPTTQSWKTSKDFAPS